MDNISSIIILRALFLYSLIDKGWTIRKYKEKKHNSHKFEIFKNIK
jgi:hypothetical protein